MRIKMLNKITNPLTDIQVKTSNRDQIVNKFSKSKNIVVRKLLIFKINLLFLSIYLSNINSNR